MSQDSVNLINTLKLLRRMYKFNPFMVKLLDGVIAGDTSLVNELDAYLTQQIKQRDALLGDHS